MAVLRNPLPRLTLGVTLLLAPASVWAQAPAASPSPVPAAPTGAAVVDAVAPPQAGQGAPAAPSPAAPSPASPPVWEDPSIDAAAAAEAEPESMGWMLVRTLMVLGAVVASIYLTLNVGLRRLMGLQSTSTGRQTVVSVVERLPLDPKRALFVVKAADEYLLVGGGEAGLQLLSKLDAEAVERIRAQRPQTNVVPLSPFLQKLLSRRSGGSSSEPPGA
ncbi:flagellar biosynthetic protein FliO [Myxococcus sp. MISCRS1]|uniref:FliO/MopB family protein n=1 Tax=Myxococcus sp. MISCRS1 TaxID=2996786 RepID=UPI00226DE05D|nr:flagellar biosynthetic protein FliO [Myxococcus sp. MISCRS1]MCY0996654.1 flagellar biosynthetic protein FliO [Myxococcus sp. MISCRS1]